MLKIYKFRGDWHHKNDYALSRLLEAKNGLSEVLNGDIFSGGTFGLKDSIFFYPKFNPSLIINDKMNVIFGPHNDLKEILLYLKSYTGTQPIYYNVLSDWNLRFHEKIVSNNNIKFITLPFQ